MEAYPQWIKVKALDCDSKKENLILAKALYANCLILIKPASEEKQQKRVSFKE